MSKIHNPWNIDPAIFHSLQAESDTAPSFSKKESKAPYRLVEGGKEDYEKVQSWYQIDAIPGYHVGRVEIIFNRTMTAGFEARVQLLEQRWENQAFSPKWSWDMEKDGIQKLRERAHTILEHRTQKYQLAERHVHLIPLFHGTDKANFDSIFRTGFDNLATTDAGFFGKGIYNTSYAEYAYRVYCKNSGGQLICNWVAFYSAYPVAHGDIDKLMGKAKFQNYDAHYALVKPKDPAKKNESVYFPIEPGENLSYDELVVFESAQTLPRYVITLEADGIGLKVVVKKTTKSELLTAISLLLQKFKEKTEVKTALEKKMKSLQSTDLTKELNSQEFALYRLIAILNEQTVLDDTILAELKMRLGLDIYSSRETTGWPLLDKYKEADLENPKTYPKDPKEQFELGLHYFNGTGIKQDFGRSAFYFILAAKQGHEMAALLSGLHYEEGKGIRPNPEKAVGYFRQAADLGNIEAKYRLGNCYYQGKGVKQDYEIAVRLFREAAKEENPDAIKRLGDCYFNGYEVKKDEKKAVELYAQAAELGSAEAKYALAGCLLEGKGTDKNGDQAVELLKDLAYAGHAQGQNRLARCYAQGEGVNPDLEKAAKYFQLAADQGVVEAQLETADCFRHGKGVKSSEQEAAKYFRLAADQGNAGAQVEFGVCSEKGVGVPPNPELALVYFQKSAEQRNGLGCYHLGRCYEQGLGVKKDYEKALENYQKGSDLAITEAKNKIGEVCYLIGEQNEKRKDLKTALEFYQKALNAGYRDAREAMGKIYYSLGEMALNQQDYQTALDYFKKGKSNDHVKSKNALGNVQLLLAKRYEKTGEVELSKIEELYWDAYINGNGLEEAKTASARCRYARYKQGNVSRSDIYKVAVDGSDADSKEVKAILSICPFDTGKMMWESGCPVDLFEPRLAGLGDPFFQYFAGIRYFHEAYVAFQEHNKSRDPLTKSVWGLSTIAKWKDFSEAFKYFKLSADQGHPGGQYGLGRCYLFGAGVQEDTKHYLKLIQQAAEQGHLDACWELGTVYCWRDKIKKRDAFKGLKYLQKAADDPEERKNAFSSRQHTLYECFYSLNESVQRSYWTGGADIKLVNLKELFSQFKTAAGRGDIEAQYMLGYFYQRGKGELEKSQQYFKMAADAGYEPAKGMVKKK